MESSEFKEKERLFLEKARDIERIKNELKRLRIRIDRNVRNSKKIVSELLEKEKANLSVADAKISAKRRGLEKERTFFDSQKIQDLEAIIQMCKEKSVGFPWLAKAYSDYLEIRDSRIAEFLEKKSRPALRAADVVRDISRERRQVAREHRVVRYLLEYYENLFPWLIDFRGEDLDDLIRQITERKQRKGEFDEEQNDPAKKWLTESEYEKLPTVEKYQLALDRYWKKKKNSWEIGRDYERYVGYLYEKEGYAVYYQGIVEGLEDLGRDLICTKDNTVEIIQCKYWSQDKTIHEKHINQLFGTTVMYWIQSHGNTSLEPKMFSEIVQTGGITPCFITSTRLSDMAGKFARALGVNVKENFPFKPYPSLKCNVSRKDGTRIYHLPFDQQYDRTLVEEERNECYVETVKQAEGLGFRRAFRWRGKS